MLEFYYNLSMGEKFTFLFISMIFMHIIGDYTLQGEFLSTFKQKINWEKYVEKNKLYKYDYIAVLLVHSFCWSIVTMIPTLLAVKNIYVFGFLVLCNGLIHAYIDDYKANKLKINLITDQILHIIQIIVSIVIVLKY